MFEEWEDLSTGERLYLTLMSACLIFVAGSAGYGLIVAIVWLKGWLLVGAAAVPALYYLLRPLSKWLNRKINGGL